MWRKEMNSHFYAFFFLHALAEVPKSTKKRTFKDNKICYHKK